MLPESSFSPFQASIRLFAVGAALLSLVPREEAPSADLLLGGFLEYFEEPEAHRAGSGLHGAK